MCDLTQRVYRVFSTAPIKPDQEALYVDLDDVRGQADVVRRLDRRIRLAEPQQPTCQVLAGHKGSGKSTELFRLKRELESGDSPFFVVYFDVTQEVDANDVDFPDVLIALVRQLAVQLDEQQNIKLKPGYFKDRIHRLGDLLTREIDFESFDLQTALGSVSGKIRSSPDARFEIRKLLEPDTSNLLYAANDVIGEAIIELREKGFSGLVVVVDDLDKMAVRLHDDAGCRTDEYLFVNRAAQLTAFKCHVVYTMPLSLVYSHHEQNIAALYGGDVPVVAMTKVRKQPPSNAAFEPGVRRFRQIIDARLTAADASFEEVFDSAETCKKLILLSGGQPTELMTLVRESIVTHDLPINDESVERARIEGRREYARLLREDHWPIIEKIRSTGRYSRTRETEQTFRELLDSRAILQYVNNEEWYGLNPLVADIVSPAKGLNRSRTSGKSKKSKRTSRPQRK